LSSFSCDTAFIFSTYIELEEHDFLLCLVFIFLSSRFNRLKRYLP
jgi:hypothetical protein